MSLIIWLICLTAGVLIAALVPVKGKKIVVLGMQGAGKTMFYRFLQGKRYVEGESAETVNEPYDGFDYTKSDGTKVHIRGGYDYGGSEKLAKEINERLVNENETIFFFFDFYEYNKNPSYKRKTNSRLNFIMKIIEDKQLYVIATHIDLIEDSTILKNSKKDFQGYLIEKGYSDKIPEGQFALVNMTDKKQLRKVVDKLF